MDLYVPGQDSLPFSIQDMLDCDMKSEIEHVLASADLTLDLGMDHSLPGFDLDSLDPLGGAGGMDICSDDPTGDLSLWLNSAPSSLTLNGHSQNTSSTAFMDFDMAPGLMVDPSQIMPVTLLHTTDGNNHTQHHTNRINATQARVLSRESLGSPPNGAKGDLVTVLAHNREVSLTPTSVVVNVGSKVTGVGQATSLGQSAPTRLTLKTVPGTAQTNFARVFQTQQQARRVKQEVVTVSAPTSSSLPNNNGATLPTTLNNTPNEIGGADTAIDRPFPKPAYSYSCLIAMALKNSKAGSLPVSEIYSFMCEHFPYFKTAPNGWKNSVRHNLSLNKCFEKIEKPAGNGSQRKGCLWAMNPAKVSKMDEEVQKWSRKDPTAIRKAMACPENLDMLERGELKREVNLNVSCEESEDEDLEVGGPSPCPGAVVGPGAVGPGAVGPGAMNGHQYSCVAPNGRLGSPLPPAPASPPSPPTPTPTPTSSSTPSSSLNQVLVKTEPPSSPPPAPSQAHGHHLLAHAQLAHGQLAPPLLIKTEPSEFISLEQFSAMQDAVQHTHTTQQLQQHMQLDHDDNTDDSDNDTYHLVNGVYEDLGEERLDLGVNITSDIATLPVTLSPSGTVEFASLPTSTIQGNYLYTTAAALLHNNNNTNNHLLLRPPTTTLTTTLPTSSLRVAQTPTTLQLHLPPQVKATLLKRHHATKVEGI